MDPPLRSMGNGVTFASQAQNSATEFVNNDAQQNEEIFNRSRQMAALRGKGTGFKEMGFEAVEASPATAPNKQKFINDGRTLGKKSRKSRREIRRAETFEKLYDHHLKRNAALESMRKKKEDEEVKYINSHGFKSLKRSTVIVDERRLGQNNEHSSVGERLHHDGLKKVKSIQDKIAKRKEAIDAEKEVWTCPKCGFLNKGTAETCQFVMGRTIPLDKIRPSCWALVDHSDPTVIRTPDPEAQLIMCAFKKPVEDFMPSNVSAQSRKLIREWQRSETVWETLHQNVAAQEKRKLLVRNTLENEDVELTLQPQIPYSSRALVQERINMTEDIDAPGATQDSSDRNIQLYNMHAQILEDTERLTQTDPTEECTFEPDIGRSKLRAKPDATQKEFVERLHKERREFDERTENLRKHYNTDYDPETGIEYFQPQTGRGPMQRESNRSIHEVLYQCAPDKENAKAAAKAKQDSVIKARSSLVHKAPKTDKMLQQINQRTYSDVYRALLLSVQYNNNPDSVPRPEMLDDDMWRTASLDTQVADPTMLAKPKMQQIVAGVLQRWKARLMSFDMFCKLMDSAMDESTDPSGLLVAPTYRTDVEAIANRDMKDCTFEPEVNDRSREISRSVRGRDGSRPIHEVLIDEKLEYQNRRRRAVKQHNERALEECTFKPNFMSKQSSDTSGNSIYPLTRQYFQEQRSAAEENIESRRILNFDDPDADSHQPISGDHSAPGAPNPESPHRQVYQVSYL